MFVELLGLLGDWMTKWPSRWGRGAIWAQSATMTWASMELITGAPRLFGLRPAGKQLPSPAKCPDRGLGKKSDAGKMVKSLSAAEKWARAQEGEAAFFASGDSAPSFARFKHLSRDSYPPPRLAGKNILGHFPQPLYRVSEFIPKPLINFFRV